MWPRCLSAFAQYGASFWTTSPMANATALVPAVLVSLRPLRPQLQHSLSFGLILRTSRPRCASAFRLYGTSCTAASALAFVHGHRGLAACQPSAYTTPTATQPQLRPDSTTLVPSVHVSLPPLRHQLHSNVSFGRILRQLCTRCLPAFGLYGPRCTVASPSA